MVQWRIARIFLQGVLQSVAFLNNLPMLSCRTKSARLHEHHWTLASVSIA